MSIWIHSDHGYFEDLNNKATGLFRVWDNISPVIQEVSSLPNSWGRGKQVFMLLGRREQQLGGIGIDGGVIETHQRVTTV